MLSANTSSKSVYFWVNYMGKPDLMGSSAVSLNSSASPFSRYLGKLPNLKFVCKNIEHTFVDVFLASV